MDWLHYLDDVVGQFNLCLFHACAAPLGGACMEKARVKLDNIIVKMVLSITNSVGKGYGQIKKK
jgi:hypothetical protein